MRTLISIDDTDEAGSRGTGDIAEILAAGLAEQGWATVSRVTRHQLLIHPDIAYTSHNSSMCFEADVAEERLDDVIDWCAAALTAESVDAADPGLAIAVVDRIADPERLMAFGRSAKECVIAKDDAYALAQEMRVHLSEHGGTGIGVIGALAGAGLRLTGSDGRFKGKFDLTGDADGVATVGQIKLEGVDAVRTLDGRILADEERVLVCEQCKLVLLEGMAVLLVRPLDDGLAAWTAVDRKSLRSY